jgi:ribokinase
MSKLQVVGLGALNMDNIYQVERIFEDGETVVKESALFPGGSAANTIYGLAKLGISTGFIGAVGDDAEGKTLIQDLQNAGVDTGQIKIKPKAKTGSALCLSDELGRRSIYVLPGANNRLTINDLDFDYINQAELLHVSSFADDKQLKILLELTGKLGPSTRLSFSPGALYASKGLEALKPILARTDVLFMNYSEMRHLTDDEVTSGAEICLEQGCNVVVVTMGKGAVYQAVEAICYIMSAENEYLVEAAQPDTPSLDTTGAGDAFAAGFLYGFFNGKGLEECGRLGGIVAQFSIAKIGARQGLPSLDELTQRYHQLYNQQL